MLPVQVYGDPLEHPQTESYWGNVNPIGERSCYDEGKRAAECLTFDYQREHNLEACTPQHFLLLAARRALGNLPGRPANESLHNHGPASGPWTSVSHA
jgi:hypothetical protein